MKQFDRLYKTIFESVKPRPSKRNLNRILKEDVNDQNTISTTPEQIEIIKKVVNQLASENEEIKDTLEFAPDMDIDYLVLKTDGCYDEWLREQGYESDQPDLFGEPEYEEFITETLRDFLTNYDCDEEGVEDEAFIDFYKFKEQLYERDMVAELKNQIPQFKAALKTIKDDDINGYYDSAQVDFSVSNLKWWDKNGLKYSPELAQEIKKYNRWNGWIYEHAFAGDDYGDWEYPDALLTNLGLDKWFFAMAEAWQNWHGDEDAFDFDKIPEQPELPLESKKVDTRRRVIKEDIGDDVEDEGNDLTTEEWVDNNWEKACAAVTDEEAKATIKYAPDALAKQVGYYYEDEAEYFQEYLKENEFTPEEAFNKLVELITDCGNDDLDDDNADWDGMYSEKQDCFGQLAEEIKASPENMEAMRLALIDLVLKEPEQSGAEVDFMLMDPSRWSQYNLTFSDELKNKIEKYNDYSSWMYEHYFASDDYCDWDIPEGLVKNIGLNDYWTYICKIVCGTYWGDGTYATALAEAKKIEKQHPEFKKYGEVARHRAKDR